MPNDFENLRPYNPEYETEAVENCGICGSENVFPNWDVKRDGYIATCQDCGCTLMLCDECSHTDDDGHPTECNYFCDEHADPETGEITCRRRNFKTTKETKTMKNFNEVCKEVSAVIGSSYVIDLLLPIESTFKSKLKTKVCTEVHNFDADESSIPSWYSGMSIADAVFTELYGWGPIAEWFGEDYEDSSLFIIDGENCFIERDGHQKLMKQRASEDFKLRLSKMIDTPENKLLVESLLNVSLTHSDCDCYVLSKAVPSKVTKQDIALQIWKMFNGSEVGIDMDLDCIESCTMRKTNSFGIKLTDGREFKVIVKTMGEDD